MPGPTLSPDAEEVILLSYALNRGEVPDEGEGKRQADLRALQSDPPPGRSAHHLQTKSEAQATPGLSSHGFRPITGHSESNGKNCRR